MTTELPHERVPVGEARTRVIASVRLLDTESVALKDLAGRTVGLAVTAPHNLPAHANSAMDGYAVVAGSAGPWTISAHILAGDNPAPLIAGTAAAIATGGVLPAGADAVVPIERVEVVDDLVTATAAIASGDFVRHVGADVQAGDVVLHPGTRLTPLATSAVAGLGLTSVPCIRRPRVVVLTTGDELVAPGSPLERGQIHESNSVLVCATLAAAGCEIVRVDNVPDLADATRSAFAAALADADLVVSTGGVSVGPRDHVKPALLELGVTELFGESPRSLGSRSGVAPHPTARSSRACLATRCRASSVCICCWFRPSAQCSVTTQNPSPSVPNSPPRSTRCQNACAPFRCCCKLESSSSSVPAPPTNCRGRLAPTRWH